MLSNTWTINNCSLDTHTVTGLCVFVGCTFTPLYLRSIFKNDFDCCLSVWVHECVWLYACICMWVFCVGVWVWLLQMGASFINSTCQWCCLFDVVFVLHFKTLSSLKLVRIRIWIFSSIVWLQNLHLPFHSLVRNCRWLHIFQHRTVNVEGIWKQAHIFVKLTLNVLTVLLVFTCTLWTTIAQSVFSDSPRLVLCTISLHLFW